LPLGVWKARGGDFRRLHTAEFHSRSRRAFQRHAHNLPPGLPLFAVSALAGGAIGCHMGSVHLSNLAIYRILGAILLLAGLKLCFT
jgi:hypothetical protein